MIISCGDLVQAGNFKLHSSFLKVINYTDGTIIQSLVVPEVGGGPFNLVVDELPSPIPDQYHFSKLVDQSNIFYSQLSIDLSRLYDGLDSFISYYKRNAPEHSLAFLFDPSREAHFQGAFLQELVKQFKTAFNAIKNGEKAKGISLFKGLGIGLTPSGDDFNGGYLLGLYLKNVPLAQRNSLYGLSLGDNLLSNSFLWINKEGRISEAYLKILETITEKVYPASLLEIGATSSADWASGLIAALTH
ncbi:MAG: DUF2877 domain-containing protein [Bacteriovoracia bacterium]